MASPIKGYASKVRFDPRAREAAAVPVPRLRPPVQRGARPQQQRGPA